MHKILILVCTICLITHVTNAQLVPSTKIHFYNAIALLETEIRTSVNQKKPIVVKPNTWAIIQLTGDSLGFAINNKTYFVHFSPKTQHYFIAQKCNGTLPTVAKISEQEFVLTVGINSAKGPDSYTLRKSSN
ncbi:hypothetical protein WBJ53_04800 [Spirosoma sp. SC4-14]|uniref:hypothetical protein n=1 Tax=Spirosoma sp. SC4-14 TaxID=3128900 RepID=UPI0030CDDE57